VIGEKMRKIFGSKKSNYEYIEEEDIKKMQDKILLDNFQNTYEFLVLCKIYMEDVKDDYGKKKIASLRVNFLQHQLDILMRECSARGIKHNLSSYQSMG
jgi:hypothetical protein